MPKEKGKPVVDYDKCMACGVCIMACPLSCLELTKVGVDKYNKVYPELIDSDGCNSCALCIKSCPIETIELKETVAV